MIHTNNRVYVYRRNGQDEDPRNARCISIAARKFLSPMRKITRTASVVFIAVIAVAAVQNAMAQTCDRACLNGFMNKFLASMKAHDPSLLPITRNAKFTIAWKRR